MRMSLTDMLLFSSVNLISLTTANRQASLSTLRSYEVSPIKSQAVLLFVIQPLYHNFERLSSICDISYIFFVEYNGGYNTVPVINRKNDKVLRFFNVLDLPPICGDIAPSGIRGMLVSWNQFAIIFGQLVVYFVNFFILGDHIAPAIASVGGGLNEILNGTEAQWAIETGWRYMFGSEMIPAGLFAILICFVPETPRYLAMIGEDAKAERILAKINGAAAAKHI